MRHSKPHQLAPLILVAGLVLAPTGAALAQIEDAPVSQVVRAGDLDLSRDADARILAARIRSAAGAVCGGAPDPRQLERHAAFAQCRQAAIRQAMAQAHAPRVSAVLDPPAGALRLAGR